MSPELHGLRTAPPVALRPEFHQLAIFLKVVETRSFAGAARLMGRTQPAISQVIARLEEIYGSDLFELRRGFPLELTPIGLSILPSARMILDTIDQQMIQAAATAQGRAGNLTLSLSPGLIFGPLRGGIARFITSSPQVRLWDERMILALPANHELARKAAVSWDDVAELALIIKNCHFELVAIRTPHDRLDRKVHIEQHDVSCTTLLEMVGLGIGATIVLASGAQPNRGVVYRPIEEADAFVGVKAVWPKDDRNPLRHRLLSHIRERKGDVDPTPPPTDPKPGRG